MVLAATSGEHLAADLAHLVLLLHGHDLLLLGDADGEGDAEEEGGGGDGPEGLAGPPDAATAEADDGGHLGGDPAAGGGGHDVAEGVEAIGEGLFLGIEFGVGGDLGVCEEEKKKKSVTRVDKGGEKKSFNET